MSQPSCVWEPMFSVALDSSVKGGVGITERISAGGRLFGTGSKQDKCLKWAPPAVTRESRLHWPGLSAVAWKTRGIFGVQFKDVIGLNLKCFYATVP